MLYIRKKYKHTTHKPLNHHSYKNINQTFNVLNSPSSFSEIPNLSFYKYFIKTSNTSN